MVKYFLFLSLIVLLIGFSEAQRISYDTAIAPNSYIYTQESFGTGTKMIQFRLSVLNGEMKVMVLSENNFVLFRTNQSYQKYDIVTDQPFTQLKFTTSPTYFSDTFYLIYTSNNKAGNIYLKGYIQITDSQALN